MRQRIMIIRGGPGPLEPGTNVPTNIAPASSSPEDPTRQVFDGFPYLVVRIGPAVYLVWPVPARAPREELIALAREQATASGLPTCLAFGLRDGVYCDPGGGVEARPQIPRGGKQMSGRLRSFPEFPRDEELEARKDRLEDYLREREHRAQGG